MEIEEIQKKMYEGFEITCKKCGSKKITIENDMGESEVSGGWGGVHLFCQDCNNSITVYEHY